MIRDFEDVRHSGVTIEAYELCETGEVRPSG
jgi:hypothetical protein